MTVSNAAFSAWSRTWTVGLVPLVFACSSGSPPATVTARDSAGILLVESSAPAWTGGEGWTVADAPALDLAVSGQGASYEFFNVADAMRLKDGRLVIADYGSREIRFFGPDGKFLTKVGRMGDGPGEFQRIESLGRFRGDSIVVHDFWLRRVTILSSRGELGRTISLQSQEDRLRYLRTLGDSGFVGFAYPLAAVGVTPGFYRVPYTLLRLGPLGAILDTLETVPGFEGFTFASGDMTVPFARNGHLAVRGERLVVGSADQLAFDRYEGGVLTQRIRVPAFDLRLSPADIDLARRALGPEGVPPPLRDAVQGVEIPALRPAYGKLLIDTEGQIWAAEFHASGAPDGPTAWQVFGRSGEWLGTVRTPARFTAFEIGLDYVLGVLRDESDMEHVQILKLNRTRGQT